MTRVFRSSSHSLASKAARFALAAAVAVAALGSVPAHAADSSIAIDFSNAYIWRGITFNDSGVAQFSLDTGSIMLGEEVGLSFNAWGNVDLGDFDGALAAPEISEIDLTVSLSLPKGFGVGYIDYSFPNLPIGEGTSSTRELYATWSGDYTVSPTVSFYYDIGAVNDFYATVELGYSYGINEKTSLDLSGLAGFSGEDYAIAYGGEKGGLYNYNLSAGVSYAATETVGLALTAGYSGSLDEDVLPMPEENALGFYVIGGVSFGF